MRAEQFDGEVGITAERCQSGPRHLDLRDQRRVVRLVQRGLEHRRIRDAGGGGLATGAEPVAGALVAVGAQRARAPRESRRRAMVSAAGLVHGQRSEPVGDLVVGAMCRFTEVDGREVTLPVRLEGDRQRSVDPAANLWCRRGHERVPHEWMREPDRHRVHLDQARLLPRAQRHARVVANSRFDDRTRTLTLEGCNRQGERDRFGKDANALQQ